MEELTKMLEAIREMSDKAERLDARKMHDERLYDAWNGWGIAFEEHINRAEHALCEALDQYERSAYQ